jgi:hypothetical protein
MALKKYMPLLALVLTIAVIYGMDIFLLRQNMVSAREGTVEQFFILTFVSRLILLIFWLALYWITFIWGEPNTAMGVIFLIVGFVIMIFPIIQVSFTGVPFLFTSYGTNLQYTAIFIMFLGILLLLKQPQRSSNPV